MGETLFIAHRIPFPPDRGDKIRSHHLLKALTKLGPVHVATLGESEADFAAEPLLAEVAASHCLARRPRNLALAGARALLEGKPVSLTAFDSRALRDWIARTLANRPIDTIFVFSGQMGQYVPADFKGRVVVDLCDVDSAKLEAYGKAGSGPRAWIDVREGRLLAAEERRLSRRADTTALISQAECTLFRSRLGRAPARLLAVGNGVDTELFDPAAVQAHPALAGGGPQIVFTGQMDYSPNVEAVQRMVKLIMPAIRARHPDAGFHVVGRAPSGEVTALEGHNGTRVWGEVPDVRPFVAGAQVMVAPLTIARGVQNKVLEAMAMARPVVLSPEAATGIDAHPDRDYAIGNTDAQLIERTLALLGDRSWADSMGKSARQFVIAHKSWETALAPLAQIVGHTAELKRDAV